MRTRQLELDFRRVNTHGGARAGAGRKPRAAALRNTRHRSRPLHRAAHPVHVTLRTRSRSLRSQFASPTVLGALRDSNRDDFQIVHYSVQANHLHLLVEARDATALSSGMRGLAVRLARRMNKLLFRRGRFWADRWHGTELTSPRQVRNALVYVLQNHAKHSASESGRAHSIDPLSSAARFDGFVSPPRARAGPLIVPGTWLLRVGWKRHGLLRHDERPAH